MSIWDDITHFFSSQKNPVQAESAKLPTWATHFTGPGGLLTDIGSVFSGGGGSSKPSSSSSSSSSSSAAASTPNELLAPFSQLVQQNYDPLGMQLLYQNSIAPMMTQIAKQMQQSGTQYDQQMNTALQNQMPAYAKQILSASAPQVEAANQNAGYSALQAAAVAPAFTQLINDIGGQTAAATSLEQALTRAYAQGSLPPGILSSGTSVPTGYVSPFSIPTISTTGP